MPYFNDGDRVALKDASYALEGQAGIEGIVWCRYKTQPASYEVTFLDQSGKPFDMTMCEDELVSANAAPREAIIHSKAA